MFKEWIFNYILINQKVYESKFKNFLLGDKMLMYLLHGIFFYLSNVALNSALKYCPLSKIILIQYLNIVYIFILSFIFLHGKIFFTDLLGACFIIGFMLYNSYYPLPSK